MCVYFHKLHCSVRSFACCWHIRIERTNGAVVVFRFLGSRGFFGPPGFAPTLGSTLFQSARHCISVALVRGAHPLLVARSLRTTLWMSTASLHMDDRSVAQYETPSCNSAALHSSKMMTSRGSPGSPGATCVAGLLRLDPLSCRVALFCFCSEDAILFINPRAGVYWSFVVVQRKLCFGICVCHGPLGSTKPEYEATSHHNI